MKRDLVKNKKRYIQYIKMVTAGILISSVAIAGLIGLAGCNKNKEQEVEDEDPPIVIQPETETPEPPVDPSTTYEEFIDDYSDEAQDFVLKNIAPLVFADKEVLSQQFYVKGNSDKLTSVDVLYTYAKDDSIRVLEQATVGLRHPIDYDEILDGNATLPSNDVEVFRTQIMDFDAKLNKTNTELVNALYVAAKKPNEDVKLFKEIKSSLDGYRMFDIFTMDDKDVNILEFGVVAGASDEEMLKNLSNPMALTNVLIKKYTLDGGYVYGEEYDLSKDDFGQEVEPGPGGEHEQQPGGEHEQDPEKEVTAQEVIDALNKNCREGAINKAFTGFLTAKFDKVENENYYINEKDGKIVSVDYTFNYKSTSTSNYYVASTITFNTPITREELKNGDFSKAKFETKYLVNYDPTTQNDSYLNKIKKEILEYLNYDAQNCISFIIADVPGATKTNYKVIVIKENEINEHLVSRENEAGVYNELTEEHKNVQIQGEKLTAEASGEKEVSAATV